MAGSSHHHTSRQAEQKIRKLKTALRNVINLPQTNWLPSLLEVTAYSNTAHSDIINMSLYKLVYGREYSLLDTYQVSPSAFTTSNDY